MAGEDWGDATEQLRGPAGWPPRRPAYVDADRRRGTSIARMSAGAGGAAAGSPFPAPGGAPAAWAFPPEYFPPEGATDFLLQGTAAGLVVGAPTVLATFQVPAGDRAVVRSVVLGVNDYTAIGNVRFALLANGNALPCWGDMRMPPQAAAFCALSFGPDETCIRVTAGSQLQLTVEVLAGGPFGASASAHGWHWSGF